MNQSIGIVIPAFQPDLEQLRQYIQTLATEVAPEAIHVELDAPVVAYEEPLAATCATVHLVRERRGKGAAISCGFEHLDTDILLFVDADGSVPSGALKTILTPLCHGESDLCVGSRRHPDSEIVSSQSLVRRVLGSRFTWIANHVLATNLYDYQCGVKAITHDAWEAVRHHLYESGFAWDIELIAMAEARGLAIKERPIVWQNRSDSTVSLVHTPFELFRGLFLSYYRAKLVRTNPAITSVSTEQSGVPNRVDYPE